MTLSNQLEANILRYHHVKKWHRGTLACHLHVASQRYKRRLLSQARIPKENFIQRDSVIFRFLFFIRDTLANYPRLTASRLYEMVHLALSLNSFSHFFVINGIVLPFHIPEIIEGVI
ncbi:MAG: transposase, family [Gammaproteobacteria bacterium]|jgi:hypothetical protein|nr:transposase, family [Gammaproteobacteria bacterium]